MSEIKYPELKPCPHCGEIAVFERVGFNGLEVKCLGCPARMFQKVLRFSMSWLAEKLAEQWNKREEA